MKWKGPCRVAKPGSIRSGQAQGKCELRLPAFTALVVDVA